MAMRLFLRPILGMTALLIAATAGGVPSTRADETGAATCDRFTLEKVRLGMTRSEVEALSLGKVEVLGEGTDTLRLQVLGPRKRKLSIHLTLGRVQIVEVAFPADKQRAEATLADLRTRWGEPDKKEEAPAPKKLSSYDRDAIGQSFRWSDRSCQAYGGYYSSARGLFVKLSSLPMAPN